MKITPLDIQKHVFRRTVRGFDAEEVQTFLFLVAEELESVIRQNLSLTAEVKRLQEMTLEHEERERILKDTLVTTQKITEHLKENAKREAELIVRDAEFRAEEILSKAQGRAAKVEEAMAELRVLRDQLRQRVRSQITAITQMIEAQEAADQHDDKLRFMKRAEAGAGGAAHGGAPEDDELS